MKKININRVFRILRKEVPKYDVPVVDLIESQTDDPFKVLVSALLSARTRDETTLNACERLFSKVSEVSDLNNLSKKEIEKLIYPVGFYKNKAGYLKELPKHLNKVPDSVEELVKLPGVGRKTANLVVAVAFKKPALAVDIHVHRIMNRLGYVKTEKPRETEERLREKLPQKYWQETNFLFVAFGQNTCKPINPRCDICPIYDECDRIGVKSKYL